MGALGFYLLRKRNKSACSELYELPRLKHVYYCIAGGVVLWLLASVTYVLTGYIAFRILSPALNLWFHKVATHHAVGYLLYHKFRGWQIVFFFILGTLVAPICEETFFRGWLDGAITKRLGDFWGISISAFIFALGHLVPLEFPSLMLTGICLSIIKRKTGSQWSNITFHSVINAISTLLIIMTMMFFQLGK